MEASLKYSVDEAMVDDLTVPQNFTAFRCTRGVAPPHRRIIWVPVHLLTQVVERQGLHAYRNIGQANSSHATTLAAS
ncbi:hypothetical protein [Arthrobacter sp. KNU40]|uniref:hypothetical protein n=1 Tax=Arthrobacter sp. KNU40 TaxID=3447965 RepID=UPI003F5EB19A